MEKLTLRDRLIDFKFTTKKAFLEAVKKDNFTPVVTDGVGIIRLLKMGFEWKEIKKNWLSSEKAIPHRHLITDAIEIAKIYRLGVKKKEILKYSMLCQNYHQKIYAIRRGYGTEIIELLDKVKPCYYLGVVKDLKWIPTEDLGIINESRAWYFEDTNGNVIENEITLRKLGDLI